MDEKQARKNLADGFEKRLIELLNEDMPAIAYSSQVAIQNQETGDVLSDEILTVILKAPIAKEGVIKLLDALYPGMKANQLAPNGDRFSPEDN